MIEGVAFLLHFSCQQAPCTPSHAVGQYDSMIECRREAFKRIEDSHDIYGCQLVYQWRDKQDLRIVKPFSKD